MTTDQGRTGRHRLVGTLSALALVGSLLVAGAIYTGAGAASSPAVAPARTAAGGTTSLSCTFRWIFFVFFNVGTPCGPTTTTTTGATTTTSLPTTTTSATTSTTATTTTTVAETTTSSLVTTTTWPGSLTTGNATAHIVGVVRLRACPTVESIPCGEAEPSAAVVVATEKYGRTYRDEAGPDGSYHLSLCCGNPYELTITVEPVAPYSAVVCPPITQTILGGRWIEGLNLTCSYVPA